MILHSGAAAVIQGLYSILVLQNKSRLMSWRDLKSLRQEAVSYLIRCTIFFRMCRHKILFRCLKQCANLMVNKSNPRIFNIGDKMKRFGWIIQVKSERLDEYKRLHAAVWP